MEVASTVGVIRSIGDVWSILSGDTQGQLVQSSPFQAVSSGAVCCLVTATHSKPGPHTNGYHHNLDAGGMYASLLLSVNGKPISYTVQHVA